jgi:hypothetical protein
MTTSGSAHPKSRKRAMKLEHRGQALLPFPLFRRRVVSYGTIAFGMIVFSLGIGVAGYRFFGRLPWIDALLNASMILTGMGPVNPMTTTAGKLFAAAYAIFSGVAFLTSFGVLAAPIFHRFLHRFHLEVKDGDS